MKRYSGFFDRLVTFENLHLAARRAYKGKKDKLSVSSFYFNMEKEILLLQEELSSGVYKPSPYSQFEIREPKVRQICSSSFRDRVVHHAICNLVDPIFENWMIHHTYACRLGKGTHKAVKQCQRFSRQYKYFLKCDIRKYFDSISHVILKKVLLRIFKDKKFLSLLFQIVDHKVPNNPEQIGLPIGNLTSQHFANFYLGHLDHFIKNEMRIKGYLRYMDDFILFSNDKEDLQFCLKEIERFTNDCLGLKLKDKATKIAPVFEGVPFLGFRVFPELIRLQRSNLVRFRKKLKKYEQKFIEGRLSHEDLIQRVNSMVSHIKHANSVTVRKDLLEKSFYLA